MNKTEKQELAEKEFCALCTKLFESVIIKSQLPSELIAVVDWLKSHLQTSNQKMGAEEPNGFGKEKKN